MTREIPDQIKNPTESVIALNEMEFGQLDGRFEYAVCNYGTGVFNPQEGDYVEWQSGGGLYNYKVSCLGFAGYTAGIISPYVPVYHWYVEQTPLAENVNGGKLELKINPLMGEVQALDESGGYREANLYEINQLFNLLIDIHFENEIFRHSPAVTHTIAGKNIPIVKTEEGPNSG